MIIRADARSLPLVDGCVDCVVTSPPYFCLRDYRIAGQIGIERTPADYIAELRLVFDEVRRVLSDTGTLWINIGDSYAASGRGGGGGSFQNNALGREMSEVNGFRMPPPGFKQKDLIGIPWMLAFALRDSGWYLRSDIIWAKPNPMPESVTDRPTKAHEYVFLLTKSERYAYNADAIRENCVKVGTPLHLAGGGGERAGTRGGLVRSEYVKRYTGQATKDYESGGAQDPSAVKSRIVDKILSGELDGRNRRSVWTIPSQPYAGAHFAVMPEALVEPCIRAGCPEGGLVLDPFSGAGTVGVVAEKLQRRYVGIELNAEYIDIARKRIAGIAPLFNQYTA